MEKVKTMMIKSKKLKRIGSLKQQQIELLEKIDMQAI
jgi:hypothetical protein